MFYKGPEISGVDVAERLLTSQDGLSSVEPVCLLLSCDRRLGEISTYFNFICLETLWYLYYTRVFCVVQLAGANVPSTRATVGGTAINVMNPRDDYRKNIIGGEPRLLLYITSRLLCPASN